MHSTIARPAAFIALLAFAAAAHAEFAVPDCAALERWSSVLLIAASAADQRDPAWQQKATAARDQMLSDDVVTSIFGRPVSQWGDSNAQEARAALGACKQTARQRGDQQAAARLGVATSLAASAARGSAVRANPDTSRLQDPGCQQVAAWAAGAAALPDGTSLEARQAHLFADANSAAVFGLGYSQWTANEVQFTTDLLNRCRQELFPRGTSTPPGSESAQVRQGLEMARGYLDNRLRQLGAPRVRGG